MKAASLVSMCTPLLLGAVGCAPRDAGQSAAQADSVSVDSMGVAPSDIANVAVRSMGALSESSALAASVKQAGVLFTINDSGNEPILFALDTAGSARGEWRVKDAKNVDWEAIAVGPCGSVAPTCIYIGDVGDNDAVHRNRTVYRLAEPRAEGSSSRGSVRAAQSVTFIYADGPHDVEAMYVGGSGDLFLITKRALSTDPAHLRRALVFRIPSEAWARKGRTIAQLVDSLSIVPGSAPFRTITDASMSPDGRHVAVRTYSQLFVYSIDQSSGHVDAGTPAAVCNLAPLGEAQGEGVTWIASSGRFAFSSEGRAAPIHLANCPVTR